MFTRIKGRVHYNIRSMFLSTKNKSVMLQIITLAFFQTLLKTAFSCGLCYYDRRIVLSYYEKSKVKFFFSRTKGRVHYNTFNEQQKSHVTNIYTVEEKQKYHVTFFCEKNKSIILHHVLPNSPENVFLKTPLL